MRSLVERDVIPHAASSAPRIHALAAFSSEAAKMRKGRWRNGANSRADIWVHSTSVTNAMPPNSDQFERLKRTSSAADEEKA